MSRKPARRPPVVRTVQPMPPNLPQHDLPEPYSRLQFLGSGDFPKTYDQVAAQIRSGDAQAGPARLLDMALDETYYDYYDLYEDEQVYFEHEPRYWTRTHAVRVLARLGGAAHSAIVPLMDLLSEEDDALREEMPVFYAAMGAPAVEPLTKVLTDSKADSWQRVGAGDSLEEIAEAHPDLRSRIVAILEQALVTERDDAEVTGFLVCNLMDLRSHESLPFIEQAFKEERVDEMIVQMADVEEHFGLARATPRKNWKHFLSDEEDEDDEDDEEDEEFDGSEPPAFRSEEPVSKPYVAPVKVGRNDLCPCGSGKKYKKCHGAVA